jgi:hypothetical protein
MRDRIRVAVAVARLAVAQPVGHQLGVEAPLDVDDMASRTVSVTVSTT